MVSTIIELISGGRNFILAKDIEKYSSNNKINI